MGQALIVFSYLVSIVCLYHVTTFRTWLNSNPYRSHTVRMEPCIRYRWNISLPIRSGVSVGGDCSISSRCCRNGWSVCSSGSSGLPVSSMYRGFVLVYGPVRFVFLAHTRFSYSRLKRELLSFRSWNAIVRKKRNKSSAVGMAGSLGLSCIIMAQCCSRSSCKPVDRHSFRQ